MTLPFAAILFKKVLNLEWPYLRYAPTSSELKFDFISNENHVQGQVGPTWHVGLY